MQQQPQQQADYPSHQAYHGYAAQPGAPVAAPTAAPTHQHFSHHQNTAPAAPVPVGYAAYPQQGWHPHQQTVLPAGPAGTSVSSQLPYPSQHPQQQQQHQQHQQPLLPQQQQAAPQHYGSYATPSAPAVPGYPAVAPAPAYGHDAAVAGGTAYGQAVPPSQPPQQALTLPLLSTPQQPVPAGPGQTLGAYAYPGGEGVGGKIGGLTPQQVAQEAIAKTVAAMDQQQQQQHPGQVLDNRRGYMHGILIGKMEKARLELAAEKNENYVRRKDEIAKRRRLGLPLDGLVDKKSAENGGGAGAAKSKQQPPRQPSMAGSQSRAGIGIGGTKVPNTSVYIAGLPSDVTQAKLELVFSQHGKVKRVKVYRDEAGAAKGDGLVTYAKASSVDLALSTLNGHEISAGHPIIVSLADFSRSDKAGTEGADDAAAAAQGQPEEGCQDTWEATSSLPPQGVVGEEGGGGGRQGEGGGEAGSGELPPLPEECGADKNPVVVLRNVYTREESDSDPHFFDDLEADMLMECVKFGTVIRVATPETPGYFGSVCVTFDTTSGANECATAMHGRWFDQRQIEALVTGKFVPDKEGKGDHWAIGQEGGDVDEEEEEEAGGAGGEGATSSSAPSKPDSPPPTDLNSFLESV